MPVGQQPDQDYGYMDGYLKKKYGQPEVENIESQANNLTEVANMANSTTDTQSFGDMMKPSPEFAKGAQRGQSAGLGGMLLSGGVASGNPYAIGGGLAISALEGNSQAKQAEEEARAIEAQQRKQAQLSAINNLISVSKGLSVM